MTDPTTDVVSKKYYKVLVNGKSCHGGNLIWSLPTENAFGEWHSVEGNIVLCSNGLHLTSDPNHWWKDGCTVYEAEIDGTIGDRDDSKAKVVVAKTRLLKAVSVIKIDGNWKITQDESRSSGWSDPVK